MTILDTLDDEDSSSSWQPLSMTALAFLFMVSVFVRLILSCSKSGSMLDIWVVKTARRLDIGTNYSPHLSIVE